MGRRSDARERLIRAAIRLIWERSYADVGVEELCRTAGAQRGSFYHFFPSKVDLAIAAAGAFWEHARRTIYEPAFRADVPPLVQIERLFRSVHRQYRGIRDKTGRVPGCPFGNLGGELATLDERIREAIDRILAEHRGYFERALAALDPGEARAHSEHIARRAERLVAYFEGVLLLAKIRDDPEIILDAAGGAVALARAAA